jgi:ABC-type multidrug transport system ATPase subunit
MIKTDAIRASGLAKAYDGLSVLRSIQLQVAMGESIAIMGANGAGKTTLLRCLAGITRLDGGELWWHGARVHGGRIPKRNGCGRNAGMIAHACQLYPNLTLFENLLFAARMNGLQRPRQKARDWLARMDLWSHADWLPRTISHGMRRRVSIARGLIHQPAIIFMDEPFSGLDGKGRAWLADLLAGMQLENKCICFTTHNRQHADQSANRVLLLRDGVLQQIAVTQKSAIVPAQRLIA